MSELTLWHIEADLANLIDLREEMAFKAEDVAALDQQIAEYCQRELRKVDGIRSYLKHAEMMAKAAEAEAVTQASRAKAWQARIDRLKAFCQMVMEGMDWKPDQVRKLEGRSGSITLSKNGGKQAVEVTDASLIPEEFYSRRVTIPGFIWGQVDTLIDKRGSLELWKDWCGLKVEQIPNLSAISAEIDKPCPTCKGRGHDAESYTDVTKPCEACGGSGKRGVAGARLAPKGSHVEIR